MNKIKALYLMWLNMMGALHFRQHSDNFFCKSTAKKQFLCNCKDTFPHKVSIKSCKTAIPKCIQICPSHSLVYIKSTVLLKFQFGWQ